ncbi:MAG TPA: OB-fold domain-containing protein [Spongiibacteraceae bacterium]|nr:OB-fold domain-containing protein [Spongiibacteraceae bacterium]
MSSAEFPTPDRDLPALRPFWSAAAQQRLELPRCNACRQFNWYPGEQCRHCSHAQFTWIEVTPRGTLFSWSVVQRPLFAPYALIAPYIPAIVELSAAPGVRLVTRLVDAEPSTLQIGAPIELLFADLTYPHTSSGVIAPLARLVS